MDNIEHNINIIKQVLLVMKQNGAVIEKKRLKDFPKPYQTHESYSYLHEDDDIGALTSSISSALSGLEDVQGHYYCKLLSDINFAERQAHQLNEFR